MSATTLRELRRGESATIRDVGRGATSRRMIALGFVPGSRVEVVRVAPLGDPVEYAVRGSRVSIRRGEAAAIRVEKG